MTTRESSVNLGEFGTVNFKVVENLPPNSPFGKLLDQVGVQTTPQLARGYMPGSSVNLLNNNLSHVCDFKFIFPDLSSTVGNLGLINPVTAIQKAMANAKLKATNRLRSLIQDVISGFRAALDGIILALGFDPTGSISFNWSKLKDIVRKINEITQFIAEKVEIVFEWIYLAQQVQQLIEWVMSLPDKIKAMLQNCLNQFGSSLKQISSSVKSIPSQISALTESQISTIANQFATAGKLALDAANSSKTNSGAPDALVQAFNQPVDSQSSVLLQYIAENTPSANSISANTTGSKMANSSSP